MQGAMIPHRGDGMKTMYSSIMSRAKEIHQTDGDVFLWPASGSAGWEIAIVNLLSPGDPVLCTVVGDFGERFAKVAVVLGLDARRVEIPWGKALTPERLTNALEQHPEVKAVFLTHNETSTGVTNPLAELAAVVRDHGALVVVDAVSSAGGLPLMTDQWGLDFVLSGSQKSWMCPPGLTITAIGPRAWDAYQHSTFKRFFWDLGSAKQVAQHGMTPTTPPLTLFYAFDAALDMMLDEGVEQVWSRHAALGGRTRNGVASLGLQLFAEDGYRSNTVTAITLPEGLSAKAITGQLEHEHNLIVGAGQGYLTDQMIRIGHMGWCSEADIDDCLAAIGMVIDHQRDRS